MSSLKVDNLKLKNYMINIDFSDYKTTAVWAADKKMIDSFFNIISGINKNRNTCFYNGEDIYDNKEYFQSRLYFDYKKQYLSTLKLQYLQERFRQKYNIKFNKEEFKKVSETLDIRGETELTNVYRYTKTGNTFVNYALTCSLYKPNIIINNPTINLTIQSDIKYIVNGLTDKNKYNMAVLGPDNLAVFANKVDKILIFSDYDNRVIIADNKDSLIVFNGPIDSAWHFENIIYQNNDKTIVLNDLPRPELKKIQKNTNCEVISIYHIDYYVSGTKQ